MNDKIADASALAAILFNESAEADMIERLGASILHAPMLAHFELTNICWKKIRRGEDKAPLLLKLAMLDDWDIQYREVDIVAVASLAAETGLTAYDARPCRV